MQIGVEPSNCVITKLKIDKSRKAILERRNRSSEGACGSRCVWLVCILRPVLKDQRPNACVGVGRNLNRSLLWALLFSWCRCQGQVH